MGKQGSRSQAGFSLIEILVAVAILAIVSAALSPMVVKYLQDGRTSRAASDAQALATAVLAFQLDTARWPVSDDDVLTDTDEVTRILGVPRADLGSVNVPPPCDSDPNAFAADWETGPSGGTDAALEDFLILNSDADDDPLYTASANPRARPGWNGPYTPTVPLDPWGNPYVINAVHFDNRNGGTAAVEDRNSVFILSAGPDQCWSTDWEDTNVTAGGDIGGDDVGYVIEGNTSDS